MTNNSQKLSKFQRNAIFCFIALVAICWMSVKDASAYERKVLFEDFTSTTCPPCAVFAETQEAYLEELGEAVVPIAFHVWWPGNSDPWWQDNQADNRTRVEYYGVDSVPRLFCDGDQIVNRNNMLNIIRNRSSVESPLEITLDGEIEDDVLDVNITVTSEDDIDNLTLFVALNEEHAEYRAVNNWMDHYDAMVKMIPDAHGDDFDIEGDQTLEFEFEQDMDGLGWHELDQGNLILVCWVQNNDREVQQAQNSFMTTIVQMDEWELSDASGNDDGRPEPGETIDMVVTLSVPGNRKDADECLVSLFCNDNELEFSIDEFNTGEIGSGEQITNEDNPFSFSISDDVAPHPVTFIITVEAQPGDWAVEYEFEMMIGWPDILLIDVSEDADAAEAMLGVFGDHDLPWVDYLNLAEEVIIPDDLMTHYEAVLLHTFNNELSDFFEWEELTLADYLDNGGTLVFSSPYTVLNYGEIDFFSDYLGASLDNADLNSRLVNGYQGDPYFEGSEIFLGSGDGAGNPTATPGLSTEGSGEAVLYYPDDDQIAGIAGIQNETDDFRTLLLSFPIESIGGAGGTDERYEFLGRIMNWINGDQDVFNEDNQQLYDFSLDVAYPNPFNSTSVIPFSLAKSGNITLKLYNTTGREIGQIASGIFNAGNHQVSLNASELGLTTGVYYLQLDGENGTSIGKVLFIR